MTFDYRNFPRYPSAARSQANDSFSRGGTVNRGEWKVLDPISVQPGSVLNVRMEGSGDPDLFVRFGSPPEPDVYDAAPLQHGPFEAAELVVPAWANTVFIGIGGANEGAFQVSGEFVSGDASIGHYAPEYVRPDDASNGSSAAPQNASPNEWPTETTSVQPIDVGTPTTSELDFTRFVVSSAIHSRDGGSVDLRGNLNRSVEAHITLDGNINSPTRGRIQISTRELWAQETAPRDLTTDERYQLRMALIQQSGLSADDQAAVYALLQQL